MGEGRTRAARSTCTLGNVLSQLMPHTEAKQLKILAASTRAAHFDRLPRSPAVAETLPRSSIRPDGTDSSAPAGVPQAIVETIEGLTMKKPPEIPTSSNGLGQLAISFPWREPRRVSERRLSEPK